MNAPQSRPKHTYRLLLVGVLLAIFPFSGLDEVFYRFCERVVPDSAHSSVLDWVLTPFVALSSLLYFLGFPLGTGICVLYLGERFGLPEKPMVPAVALVPFLFNVYVIAQVLPFLAMPSGTEIRPMAWSLFAFVGVVVFTVVGLVYVSKRVRRGGNWAWYGTGFVLSCLPVPVLLTSLKLAIAIKGLKVSG